MIYDHHLPYDSLFIDTLGDAEIHPNSNSNRRRRIPRIVHQTSKSRCVTNKFKWATSQWKLGDDWAYYLHTNEAVDRLLQPKLWPEFPNMALVIPCIEGQWTLKADLWRYLILWQYGGIYADIDTKPSKLNATSILVDDDGFFVVEMYHLLSQYFMATSPKHRKFKFFFVKFCCILILSLSVTHENYNHDSLLLFF
jgi:mannosyltransferase OCH1-like enzyme